MDKLHSIRSTKGFSLDEELRAYDGVVPSVFVPTESEQADLADYVTAAPHDYDFCEEAMRSEKEFAQKEAMNSRITSALRGVYKQIGSPAYRRRPSLVPLSRLPLDMEEELGHFMYSSPEVLPEELE